MPKRSPYGGLQITIPSAKFSGRFTFAASPKVKLISSSTPARRALSLAVCNTRLSLSTP
ncbi:Uncharacterised protein [Vibrio cholerae]|nr:Uncharacterised protein [Vibrio cholerae]